MEQGHRRLRLVLMFGVCMFVRLVFLAQVHMGSSGEIPAPWLSVLYYTNQLSEGVGMLIFAAIAHFCGSGARKWLRGASCIVSAFGCLCAYLLLPWHIPWVVVSQIAACSLGYVLGEAALAMSLGLSSKSLGRSLGMSYALALMLQYVLQLTMDIGSALIPLLIAGCAFVYVRLSSCEFEEKPVAQGGGGGFALIVMSVLFLLCLVVLTGFFDNLSQRTMVGSGFVEGNVYSWPRLIWVVGMLVFGFVFDSHGGRFFYPAIFLLSLMSVLIPFFLRSPGAWAVSACVYYALVSAYYSCVWLPFWKAAPNSHNPALLAGLGSLLDFAGGCLTPLFSLSGFTAEWLMLLYVAVLASMFGILLWGGALRLGGEAWPAAFEAADKEPAVREVDQEDRVASFAGTHSLTPRETDALRILVFSEDTVQVMAGELGISERMFYRHMSHIFEKTGVTTRAGLVRLFFEGALQD